MMDRKVVVRMPTLCVLALLVGCSATPMDQRPTNETSFEATKRDVERKIQQCIKDKTASPKICRQTARAMALSMGFSPDEAARLAGVQ